MANSKPVLVTFKKEILIKMDRHLEKIGIGASRSAFINEAVEYYLKLRMGLGFLSK